MSRPAVGAPLRRCAECGGYEYGGGRRLSRGPVGCPACDLAHGFRYAAVETDRPGARPGNEHGVRVNVSVVRRPQVTSGDELLVRRLVLPLLLIGALPSTDQAQQASALIKNAPRHERARLAEQAVEAWIERAQIERAQIERAP